MTAADVVFAPLHWVERARGRKRLALLVLYASVLSVAAFLLWWSQSLRNLPDIGDPFDVRAFEAVAVADDDNAFPIYREASLRLATLSGPQRMAVIKAIAGPWSAVPPEAREALETHRQALDLWKQATERPSFQIHSLSDPLDQDVYDIVINLRHTFTFFAMLEAARLEDQGDMDGAWSWYAAILRAQNHAAASRLRSWQRGMHPLIALAMGRWQADPRVGTNLLREALEELQTIDAAKPSYASSLQNEYIHNLADLEMAQQAENQHVSNEDQWYKFMPGYSRALMFAKREPERSRRILRLIYANLLAYIDDPQAEQPKIVPPGVFDLSVAPSGRDIARRISPQDLEKEIAKSLLPGYLLDGRNTITQANNEQRMRANMILGMAAELYFREQGTLPPTFNDMVGPYLRKIPTGAIGTEGPGTR